MKFAFSRQIFQYALDYHFSLKKTVHCEPSCSLRMNKQESQGGNGNTTNVRVAVYNYEIASQMWFKNSHMKYTARLLKTY